MGPRLSHLIATATIAISGKVNRMRALATIRSAMRFTPSLFETWSNPRGFGTAMVSDIVFAREELAGASSTARIPLMRDRYERRGGRRLIIPAKNLIRATGYGTVAR